jgi:hypothetical protein
MDLGKRNALIIETSSGQVFGQHGVCGQLVGGTDSNSIRRPVDSVGHFRMLISKILSAF